YLTPFYCSCDAIRRVLASLPSQPLPESILSHRTCAPSEEIRPATAGGLYDPRFEHDACGVGFVAHIKGDRRHAIVTQALKILEHLNHRGAVGADPLMGDGAGILLQIPDALYRAEMAAQGVQLPPPG